MSCPRCLSASVSKRKHRTSLTRGIGDGDSKTPTYDNSDLNLDRYEWFHT